MIIPGRGDDLPRPLVHVHHQDAAGGDPAAAKELGIEKGSPTPNRDKVGKVTKAQVKKIAELKMPDLNANTVEQAMAMVAGTARSMGIEVVD